MTLLARLTAAAATLAFLAPPALAQTDGAAPPSPPMQEQGVSPPPGMNGQNPDQMREMMREMMQEMMRSEPRAGRDRAKRRGANGRRHGGMGRSAMMEHHGRMRGPGGMRSGMMHGAGMRLIFAIVDADGDGALSLTEVQDFHGRIFNAIDEDGDGSVLMEEIESFFHAGDDEETDR
jgi:hypothetical protein